MPYDPNNYIADAHRTAPAQSTFVVFDEERHAIYGLVTEAAELLHWYVITNGEVESDEERQKWADELGDIMWYTALLLHFYGRDINSVLNFIGASMVVDDDSMTVHPEQRSQVSFSVHQISWRAGLLLDLLKKRDAYGKLFDIEQPAPYANEEQTPIMAVQNVPMPLIKMIVAHVRVIAKFYGFKIEEIMEANIAKLRARFPERFEGHLAINKDEAVEASAQATALETANG